MKFVEFIKSKIHGEKSKHMFCCQCGYSWEADEPYSYCPRCGMKLSHA